MERVNNIVSVGPSVFNGLRPHCSEKLQKSAENLQIAKLKYFEISRYKERDPD